MSLTTTRQEFENLRKSNPMVSVCREIFADADTPVGIYRKVVAAGSSPETGAFLLESASQGGVWSRFSFVGAGSFGVLTEAEGKAKWRQSDDSPLSEERLLSGGISHLQPLEALEAVYKKWESEQVAGLPPLTSGFVGFVAWEAIREIYGIEQANAPELSVPLQALSFVSELIVVDHRDGVVVLIANVLNDQDSTDADALWNDAQTRLDALQGSLQRPLASPLATFGPEDVESRVKRVTPESKFLEDVLTSKEFIANDEVSQVVISQRFDAECHASPLDVYRVLRHTNPSPFLYLLSFLDANGAPLGVVGSSPEALITVNNGQVVTHPIAGSRPRGTTPQEDRDLEAEMMADEKEVSEHEMLVDLAKQDLSAFCIAESIRVQDYMRVERFSHVMHIVSTVIGDLAEGQNTLSALRATFPAGTLSGSPKPRALEIIEELEPEARGVYGGVVGYFSLGGDADLAIAIRTATIQGQRASVQAGAGIVAASLPEKEDEETRNKAAAPLKAISVANALRHLS